MDEGEGKWKQFHQIIKKDLSFLAGGRQEKELPASP